MTPEMLKPVVSQLFGQTIVEVFLQHATQQPALSLAIGQIIAKEALESTQALVLLEGRIRVLQRTVAGKEQTLMMLAPGDIWDSSLLANEALMFAVSSDKAAICLLPLEVVQQHAVLQNSWATVQQKAQQQTDHLAHQPAASVSNVIPLLPVSASNDTLTSQEATVESDVLPPIPQHATLLQSWAAIEKACDHYNIPLPKVLDAPAFKDASELAYWLEQNGFRVHNTVNGWQQLLNHSYPLLIVGDDHVCRWVVNRQGNTLIDNTHGTEVRYMPPGDFSKAQFSVLALKPLRSKQLSFLSTPYTLGWYVRLCTQNWFLSMQMVVSSFVLQIFALGTPLFYMVIFDRVFGHQNLNTLDVMAVGMLMIFIFDTLIRVLRAYVLSHLLESIDRITMDEFVEQIFAIPLAKTTLQMSRSFAERFPELFKMNQGIAMTFLMSSLDVAFSVLLVAFLLILHTQLALISLASLLPIAVMSFYTSPLTKKRAMAFSKDQRGCQIKLSEAMDHNETIQSLNAQSWVKWKVAEKIEEHLQRGFDARFDRVSGPIGQNFVASVGSVVTLYFGAHEVLQGEISYGVYMAINMLSRQVIGSVQRLFASLIQFQEAMGTMEQFRKLYREEDVQFRQHEGVVVPHIQGRIQLQDVRFRYTPESPWVLNSLQLNIEPGQKVVITGKSGAGKTTLLRLLQRLYEPQSGYITLDGYNLADMDERDLRHHIGVALQRPALFAGTIAENIAFGSPQANMKAIVDAATMAQLDQDLLKLPQGFDTPLAPMGANLSGGQAARIALARIFLLKPSILVLDEALAACDPTLNAAIFTTIFEKYKHATCILVTDYLPVHQRADNIIVLHEGRIVEQGTFRDLSQVQGYYTHLHHQLTASGRRPS